MAQGQPDDEQARAQEQAVAQPPLPGPADEISGPMTIIPGPVAEDSPAWRPEQHAPQTSPAPAHYQAHPPATSGRGGDAGNVFVRVVDPPSRPPLGAAPGDRASGGADMVHVVGVQDVPRLRVDDGRVGQFVVVDLG